MAVQEQVYGFFIPTVTLMGIGAHKEIGSQLKTLGASKPLIVTDKGLTAAGITEQISTLIKKDTGIECVVFDETVPNPTDINVRDGLEVYKANSQIYTDAPVNGLSLIILPVFSDIHTLFALNSMAYEGFAASPLIGWISGFSLDDPEGAAPKTFDGTAAAHKDKAVVFHIDCRRKKRRISASSISFSRALATLSPFRPTAFTLKKLISTARKLILPHILNRTILIQNCQ